MLGFVSLWFLLASTVVDFSLALTLLALDYVASYVRILVSGLTELRLDRVKTTQSPPCGVRQLLMLKHSQMLGYST